MSANMERIDTKLFDACVRVETMFWLPGMAAMPPREFTDFMEDDLFDSKNLLAAFPWFKTVDREYLTDPEELMGEFARRGCLGFIVQLARPVPSNFYGDGKGYSFSWGHYQCEWFYFETISEIGDAAVKWGDEVVERERKRKKPKGTKQAASRKRKPTEPSHV